MGGCLEAIRGLLVCSGSDPERVRTHIGGFGGFERGMGGGRPCRFGGGGKYGDKDGQGPKDPGQKDSTA